MTVFVDFICDRCRHEHIELYDGWNVACDAFPKGQPKGQPNATDSEEYTNCNNEIGFEPK
jgi:hypothetical protein